MLALVSIVSFAQELRYNTVLIIMYYLPALLIYLFLTYQANKENEKVKKILYITIELAILFTLHLPIYYGLSLMINSILLAQLVLLLWTTMVFLSLVSVVVFYR